MVHFALEMFLCTGHLSSDNTRYVHISDTLRTPGKKYLWAQCRQLANLCENLITIHHFEEYCCWGWENTLLLLSQDWGCEGYKCHPQLESTAVCGEAGAGGGVGIPEAARFSHACNSVQIVTAKRLWQWNGALAKVEVFNALLFLFL